MTEIADELPELQNYQVRVKNDLGGGEVLYRYSKGKLSEDIINYGESHPDVSYPNPDVPYS